MRNIIFLIFWYKIIQNNIKYCNLRYSKLLKKKLACNITTCNYLCESCLWSVYIEISNNSNSNHNNTFIIHNFIWNTAVQKFEVDTILFERNYTFI